MVQNNGVDVAAALSHQLKLRVIVKVSVSVRIPNK